MWHQLLFMRKGKDDFTYFDGKLLSATYSKKVVTDKPLNMTHNWFIGTFSGNNPNYSSFNYSFLGLIDEMRIYNRALSESEIQQLYNYQTCQPSIDIKLKVTGDKVVANSHIQGPSSSCKQSDVVETAWIKLPNNFVIPLIKPFTKLRLLPGSQLDTDIPHNLILSINIKYL